jgi:hypothetical protein
LGDMSLCDDLAGEWRTCIGACWYGDYINGFGDVAGDHWLGLELMHLLTSRPGSSISRFIAAYPFCSVL